MREDTQQKQSARSYSGADVEKERREGSFLFLKKP